MEEDDESTPASILIFSNLPWSAANLVSFFEVKVRNGGECYSCHISAEKGTPNEENIRVAVSAGPCPARPRRQALV